MFVGIYFASSFLNVVYESNVKAGPGVDKKAQVADNLVSPLNAQRNGESVFVNFYVVTLIGVSRQFVEDTGLQPDTVAELGRPGKANLEGRGGFLFILPVAI